MLQTFGIEAKVGKRNVSNNFIRCVRFFTLPLNRNTRLQYSIKVVVNLLTGIRALIKFQFQYMCLPAMKYLTPTYLRSCTPYEGNFSA